jgi:hypothetical protein
MHGKARHKKQRSRCDGSVSQDWVSHK